MVFERATEFPTREEHLLDCPAPRSAYGFSKLAGEVYCQALHDEHGLPYTICRPFNAYRPGELLRRRAGIAHMVPDVIRKVLGGARPLPIFGSGEQTRTLTHVDDIADGVVTCMAHPPGRTRTSTSRRRRSAAWRRSRGGDLGGLREDPAQFELEHLPSFEVDVQRRWPSVRRPSGCSGCGGAHRPAGGDRRHGGVAARAQQAGRGGG